MWGLLRAWCREVSTTSRLGHEETLDHWDDLDRDVDGAVSGDLTLRAGWRHVDQPCRTATRIGRVLQVRGWTGALRLCGPDCTVRERGPCERGGFPAPGAR